MAGMNLLTQLGQASPRDTSEKGAQIYCYMRDNGNEHEVSWRAAYALIKRQSNGLFKTSPRHAAVMITEAVVQEPTTYPNCGSYLGDLFGGATPITNSNISESEIQDKSINSKKKGSRDRYSY